MHIRSAKTTVVVTAAQAQGAIVVLKWDGERPNNRCTVVIARKDTNVVWRRECDDISRTLGEVLADYRSKHS